MTRRPRVLSIAGSDSGGGAGIQADLKTIAAHGGYGTTAITAITAQNTLGVRAVAPVPLAVVAAEIDAVFEDIGVDAVKIGMLATAELVAVVGERLHAHRGPPIVLDPVMVAASGDPLLEPDAVAAIRRLLFPLATLVTPNLPEAERLLGRSLADLGMRGDAARELAGTDGPGAVLIKGGHGAEPELVDLLWDGACEHRFAHPRRATRATHGTGCTLSAAIACRLARGERLVEAVGGAIEYLQRAIAAAYPVGSGSGPVDPFWRIPDSAWA